MSERVPNWPDTGCTASSNGGVLLSCKGCTASKRWPLAIAPAPARVWAERQGWQIDKKWREALCPTCAAAKKEQESKEAMTANAKKGTRRVWALLEEHYNEDTKCYDPEWSDERISNESGLSIEVVATTRAEHFGPIEDPRITELRAEVEAQAAALQAARAELESLVRAEPDKLDKAIADLARRANRLRL
jgi:hypothetical protein